LSFDEEHLDDHFYCAQEIHKLEDSLITATVLLYRAREAWLDDEKRAQWLDDESWITQVEAFGDT